MYGINERNQLMTYVDGVFVPLARPAAAADVIVNIAGFGTCHWDDEDGVCEGLKQVIMGPQCINVAKQGFKCSQCGFYTHEEGNDRMEWIKYCPDCGCEVVEAVPGVACGESHEN